MAGRPRSPKDPKTSRPPRSPDGVAGPPGVPSASSASSVSPVAPFLEKPTVELPAVQTYADGQKVNWNQPTKSNGDESDHPAPTLTLPVGTGGHGVTASRRPRTPTTARTAPHAGSAGRVWPSASAGGVRSGRLTASQSRWSRSRYPATVVGA